VLFIKITFGFPRSKQIMFKTDTNALLNYQ